MVRPHGGLRCHELPHLAVEHKTNRLRRRRPRGGFRIPRWPIKEWYFLPGMWKYNSPGASNYTCGRPASGRAHLGVGNSISITRPLLRPMLPPSWTRSRMLARGADAAPSHRRFLGFRWQIWESDYPPSQGNSDGECIGRLDLRFKHRRFRVKASKS